MVAQSAPQTISLSEVSQEFDEVVRRLFAGNEHFVVERNGEPVAVILSVAEYETLIEELQREARVRRFRENARAIGAALETHGMTEEEALAQLEETQEEVYQEYYGDPENR